MKISQRMNGKIGKTLGSKVRDALRDCCKAAQYVVCVWLAHGCDRDDQRNDVETHDLVSQALGRLLGMV